MYRYYYVAVETIFASCQLCFLLDAMERKYKLWRKSAKPIYPLNKRFMDFLFIPKDMRFYMNISI